MPASQTYPINHKNTKIEKYDELIEIAKIKLPDLNTTKLESALKIVEGTAKNMGISVIK